MPTNKFRLIFEIEVEATDDPERRFKQVLDLTADQFRTAMQPWRPKVTVMVDEIPNPEPGSPQ